MAPSLESLVGRLLRRQGATLAVAESCTGGLLGGRITSVPGSSDYFLGGVIAYSNAAKELLLGVESRLLKEEGAVSAAVARAMATGVRRLLGADFALGVTGVAGPAGGTSRKPVGLVWIGLAGSGPSRAVRFVFSGGRAAVRRASCRAALGLLEEVLERGASRRRQGRDQKKFNSNYGR